MHVKLVPMSQKINDVASTNMDRFGLKQQTVVNSCEVSVQQRDGGRLIDVGLNVTKKLV
jgi:hypothetical protein